jgi:hypothetical protein
LITTGDVSGYAASVAGRSGAGHIDGIGPEVEVDVVAIALAHHGREIASRGKPAAAAAVRAVDGQLQILGLRVQCRWGKQAETELANGMDRLTGAAGDGAVELALGHDDVHLVKHDDLGSTGAHAHGEPEVEVVMAEG